MRDYLDRRGLLQLEQQASALDIRPPHNGDNAQREHHRHLGVSDHGRIATVLGRAGNRYVQQTFMSTIERRSSKP